MQGRNIALYIIILALTAAAILFMMYQTRRIDANLYNSQVEANTEELIADLDQLDYEIYWIGELPQYMDGIADHVTLLTAADANSDTLPVVEGTFGFNEYDETGALVSHTEQRDYASYMMIVVNTSEELTEETLSAIQDSVVENHVPILLIGDQNINAFRSYMILVEKDYEANSSLFFEISRYPEDNPLDPEAVGAGGHAYADALLTFIHSTFMNPVVVPALREPVQTTIAETTETVETSETSIQETETAVTEETSDAA